MHLSNVLLLTQSCFTQLTLAVITLAFYEDNGCTGLGVGCQDTAMWECCEGTSIYGSAIMYNAFCFTFTPASFQNGNPCAITLGNVDENVCFDSEYWQITGGYWWWDVLSCLFKERDVESAVDDDAAIAATNATMVKSCRKADMHVYKEGGILYGIKMDSDEGRTFAGLERGSAEQKAYILANSHTSEPV